MLIGRYDDPATRTRVDVDMRVDAALTDEPKRVEAYEQRLTDLRTLANQHEHLCVLEARGERIDILRVVVPDRHLVSVEFAKARERSKRVEIVIENRNLHGIYNWGQTRFSSFYFRVRTASRTLELQGIK